MAALKEFLVGERDKGKRIFPKGSEWFHALDATPLENVRVVILGQDPYHGEGQAHGLCFSVRPGVRPPPSLLNIYKEMKSDMDLDPPGHGNLEAWAKQGVLLLNSVLTVEAGLAGAHQGKGGEGFGDEGGGVGNDRPPPGGVVRGGAGARGGGEVGGGSRAR